MLRKRAQEDGYSRVPEDAPTDPGSLNFKVNTFFRNHMTGLCKFMTIKNFHSFLISCCYCIVVQANRTLERGINTNQIQFTKNTQTACYSYCFLFVLHREKST